MTVTTQADIQVATPDLRNALRAVLPHTNPVITGDDEAEHRIRLVFGETWMFALASNGATSALAKVRIVKDSRTMALAKDDGPLIVDLQPRRAKLVLQQFKAKEADPNVGQLVEFGVDVGEGVIDLTDIGGLWSSGESIRYPIDEPDARFPDIISVTSRALAGVGTTTQGKQLVTDSRLLSYFKVAGQVYEAPLQIEGTGTTESRGFVVSCGAHFLGTVESRHNDDDSLKKRDAARLAWLELLPARKLVSA